MEKTKTTNKKKMAKSLNKQKYSNETFSTQPCCHNNNTQTFVEQIPFRVTLKDVKDAKNTYNKLKRERQILQEYYNELQEITYTVEKKYYSKDFAVNKVTNRSFWELFSKYLKLRFSKKKYAK